MGFLTGFLWVIILLCIFYFLSTIFQAWRTNKLREKYNPEEDMSREIGKGRENHLSIKEVPSESLIPPEISIPRPDLTKIEEDLKKEEEK